MSLTGSTRPWTTQSFSDVFLADQFAPFGVVAIQQVGELLGCRQHGIRPGADKALANIGHGDCLAHGIVQPIDDRAGHFRRRENRVPIRRFDVLETSQTGPL